MRARSARIRFVKLESGFVPEAIPEDFDGRDAIVEMTGSAINITCGTVVD